VDPLRIELSREAQDTLFVNDLVPIADVDARYVVLEEAFCKWSLEIAHVITLPTT
jgi:hypothetical protein